MKLRKKYLDFFLIWLLCLFFSWMIIYSARINPRVAVLEDSFVFQSENLAYTSGYEIKGTYYKSIDGDPQICYSNINAQTGSIGIYFEKPLMQDIVVQIYYAEPETGLEESKSVIRNIKKGETEKVINLPVAVYKTIRVDLTGDFYLKEIIRSSENASFHESLSFFNGKEIICAIIVSFILLICILYGFPKLKKQVCNFKTNLIGFDKEKKVLFYISIFSFLFWIVCWIIALITTEPLDRGWYIGFFAGTIIECILILGIRFRLKKLTPEFGVFMICFMLGSYLCVTLPLGSGTSWDGQIHYDRALELSHSLDRNITLAEFDYTKPYFEDVSDKQNVSDRKKELNELYIASNTEIEQAISKTDFYTSLPYLPSAIMLFLGRGFMLPFHAIFMLGKWANVLLFSILVYFSIRKLKSGKLILGVIALFPTNIFLTGSYSYDTWLTAFFMLGTAYVIGSFQHAEKPLRKKELVIPILAYFLGCAAKAVYFPIFGLLLFYKKSMFKNEKIMKKYRLILMAVCCLVVLSFIIPMFITKSTGITDTRGGTEVNGGEQIKYMLSNPVAYSRIMISFLKNYLSLNSASGYIDFFAYLGGGQHFVFILVLLGIVTVTDKNESDCKVPVPFRIFSCLLSFITIILVASALYITFTPLMADIIAGCQPRYLIPLLFPVLSVLGNGKSINKHSDYYCPIILGCMLYVLAADFGACFLKLYL